MLNRLVLEGLASQIDDQTQNSLAQQAWNTSGYKPFRIKIKKNDY